MNLKVLKPKVHAFCVEWSAQKLEEAHSHLKELQRALSSETKSSAGDKHETGRAMIHLEIEKAGQRLKVAEHNHTILSKLSPTHSKSLKVIPGSFIHCNTGWYYLTVAIGKIDFEGEPIWCLSPESPLGRILIGKSQGDHFEFNGKSFEILQIC